MNLHEFGNVKLGCLQNLDFAHKNIGQRVDSSAGLLNLLSDGLGDELEDQLLHVAGGGLLGHDLRHLLADGADLGGLGVARPLEGVLTLFGESNAEQTHAVSVSGDDVGVRLNEGLPLADKGPELVSGKVHAPEVAQDVASLHVFSTELHLAEGLVLILVEVCKRALENTSLQSIRSNLCSLCTGDKGLADASLREERGGLDVVPILLGKGIDGLLLATSLSLSELVFSNRHV
mmetsp:Transcript_39065/g.54280  ORF Transcript_39065/g.54280 Transcript_39065/m.54280 type:complete len:233 (-) Transcript_39065:56-754(-)